MLCKKPSVKTKILMAPLLFILLILFGAGIGTGNPVYQKPGYDFIWISSPTQKTYNTGPIHLSFTFKTNFNPSYLSFCYTLDGTGEYLTGPVWDAMLKVSEKAVSTRIVSDDDPGLGCGPYPPYTDYIIACDATLPPLQNGEHNITVYRGLNYPAKNALYEPFSMVHFSVKSQAPRVLLLSPRNDTYNSSSVLLSFRIDGEVPWLGYSLDEKANITITESTSQTNYSLGHYNYRIVLAGLSEGSHSLTVYAKGDAVNMGKSETVHFIVKTIETQSTVEPMQEPEQSAPFVATLVTIATVASVAIVSFGLVAYSLRRKEKRSKT